MSRSSLAFLFCFSTLLYSAPALADGEEDDQAIQELNRVREMNQKAYESLNQSNPLSTDFRQPGSADAPANAQVAAVAKLLNNPVVQGSLKLATNPAIGAAVQQISNHPNRNTILMCEGGWFLFFIFFRAWRNAKAKSQHWFKNLIFRFINSIVYMCVASGIPVVFLGDPYIFLLKSVWASFVH